MKIGVGDHREPVHRQPIAGHLSQLQCRRLEPVKDFLVARTRAEDRVGTVNDIADAVLLLADEKSRWITGQVISVSGGITGG